MIRLVWLIVSLEKDYYIKTGVVRRTGDADIVYTFLLDNINPKLDGNEDVVNKHQKAKK